MEAQEVLIMFPPMGAIVVIVLLGLLTLNKGRKVN